MSFTLWRGDRLLGELCPRREPEVVARVRSHRQLSAVLLPTAPAPDALESVWQVRIDIFPGRPLLQHPREPDGPGFRGRVEAAATSRSVVGLHPATDAEKQGVPRERQLQVRDAAGRTLAASQITLQEFVPASGTEAELLAGYPAGVLCAGRVWLVDAALDPGDAVA